MKLYIHNRKKKVTIPDRWSLPSRIPFGVILLAFAVFACSPKQKKTVDQMGSKSQTVKADANIAEVPLRGFDSDLPATIGNTISKALLDTINASMSNFPDPQSPAPSSMRRLLAKGDPASELVSISVVIDNNYLLALDYTLRLANENSGKRKENLLLDYVQQGTRSISLLNDKLEVFDVPIKDYQHKEKSNLRAVAFDATGILRIVLFDSNRTSADALIPTTKSLPPGLLTKAQRFLQTQKAIHKKKEGQENQ
jgi:hypothetical protein